MKNAPKMFGTDTSARHGLRRVNKREHCPICDHADWCLLAVDGSTLVLVFFEYVRRDFRTESLQVQHLSVRPAEPSGASR